MVIRQACAVAATARQLGVAVNLSPAQFKGAGLVDVVVARWPIGPAAERLELEIRDGAAGEQQATSSAVRLRAGRAHRHG